jgi:hypothetical protein
MLSNEYLPHHLRVMLSVCGESRRVRSCYPGGLGQTEISNEYSRPIIHVKTSPCIGARNAGASSSRMNTCSRVQGLRTAPS